MKRSIWLNRGAYGTKLYHKINKFDKLMKDEEDDIKLMLDISRAQDYAIQMQLSNIKAIEDFETLEKLETWKNELLAGRGKIPQEAVLRTKWQY